MHFSPDVEARLQQVASANGKDAEQLVKETVNRMLENRASFVAGVQRGIEQANRGEFVEHGQGASSHQQLISFVRQIRWPPAAPAWARLTM